MFYKSKAEVVAISGGIQSARLNTRNDMAGMMNHSRKLWKGFGCRFFHTKSCDRSPVIPTVIEQTGGVERGFDIFSRLLRERIVCVFGPITDDTSGLIIAQLLFLQSESAKKPINMYINSPGGSVTAGLAVYDTMQYIQAPVSTWCVGQACSMGSLLLCAGSMGQRHSLTNARIMIHQPSGQAAGRATDINIQAEEIIRMKKQTNEIYYKHTSMPLEKIEELIEKDTFMTPHDALDYGLIDKVLTPNKLTNREKKK